MSDEPVKVEESEGRLRTLLRARIPRSAILKFWITCLAGISLALLSLLVYIPSIPASLGETSGEAAISRGGCVFTILPFALGLIGLTSLLTGINSGHLSLRWRIVGYSPAVLAAFGALLLIGLLVFGG